MFGAEWMNLTAAGVFALVGTVSLVRLFLPGTRPHGRVGDAWHVVMAAGMVGMTLPAADPVPRWAWAGCFAVGAGWAVVTLARIGPVHSCPAGTAAWRRDAGQASHLLAGSLLMLLMVWAAHGSAGEVVPPAHGHGLSAGSGNAVVWLAGVGFLLVAVRTATRVPRAARDGRRGLGSPTVALVCSATMTAGMGAMALAVA